MADFKKDYLNYLFYTVINSSAALSKDPDNSVRKILESVIKAEDIVKIAFIIGKTEGLDVLFKFILYVSDKIDKSQVKIFNLKDNFEYDVQTLKNLCSKIEKYILQHPQTVEFPSEEEKPQVTKKQSEDILQEIQIQTEKLNTEEDSIISFDAEVESKIQQKSSEDIDTAESENITGMTEDESLSLIENKETRVVEEEVFELEKIIEEIESAGENEYSSDYLEEPVISEEPEIKENEISDKANILEETTPDDEVKQEEDSPAHTEENEIFTQAESDEETKAKLPDLEFEIKDSYFGKETVGRENEETITSEVYYKFENKFFEDVKILEKLFSNIEKESRVHSGNNLREKILPGLTQIIEISSELADLTRQLSFDVTAEIFLTINLFCTKAINNAKLLTQERLNLMKSSLVLVNSLIKGEDYLNYDIIVEKMEALKSEIQKPQERESIKEKIIDEEQNKFAEQEITQQRVPGKSIDVIEEGYKYQDTREQIITRMMPQEEKESEEQDMDSSNFKMRYFVKEFEKTFLGMHELQGEFSKYDALDLIDALNNSIRAIAKISVSIKMNNVCKLAEVSYVFLKYLKDYRINLMDQEIQQIIKYVIFSFKMLLTNRKPEDFNVLVQYLNNPEKIFTDT